MPMDSSFRVGANPGPKMFHPSTPDSSYLPIKERYPQVKNRGIGLFYSVFLHRNPRNHNKALRHFPLFISLYSKENSPKSSERDDMKSGTLSGVAW
jgi:hypothetical protein